MNQNRVWKDIRDDSEWLVMGRNDGKFVLVPTQWSKPVAITWNKPFLMTPAEISRRDENIAVFNEYYKIVGGSDELFGLQENQS
jgi:hypothetical protein